MASIGLAAAPAAATETSSETSAPSETTTTAAPASGEASPASPDPDPGPADPSAGEWSSPDSSSTSWSSPSGSSSSGSSSQSAAPAQESADGRPGIADAPQPPTSRPAPDYVSHPVGARQRAAAYAYTWSLSTNPRFYLAVGGKVTVPSDNRRQRGRAVDPWDHGELDCTNYMSQALRVGGFDYLPKWGYNPRARSATTAWVRASGPESLSATFIKAGRMRLLNPKGAGLGQRPPAGVQIGDVIAWDVYGTPGRLIIDHQIMVTEVSGSGRSWSDIRVSYHTFDHQNRAMDEYQAFVTNDWPKARLYVFHVNYPS